jgi:phospholipase/carboxylesterase
VTDIHENGDEAGAGVPVYAAGTPLPEARAAMIMLHGRGGSAPDILGLAGSLQAPGLAFLAPQAAGNTWYPHRFIEPASRNEPHLSAALSTVRQVIAAVEEAGLPAERIIILGFSQGACLGLEYAKRSPRRYGGLVGLSGGLIGTDAEVDEHGGDLAGTPVILGCSDVDFHIPLARVKATARVLEAMNAAVEETIYPDMGHGIVEDEIRQVRDLIARVLDRGA